MDEAAAAAIGLDAEAVVGAVDGEVVDEEMIDAAEGAAADGHAVAAVEVIVEDGHVGDAAHAAGLETDIVVAGVNVAVGDGDVFGGAGIDAVGVARGFGGHDFDAPRGEAVGLIDGDVEAGRVAQRDFVEDEAIDVAQGDHGEDALRLVFHFGFVREVPPGDVLAEEVCAAAGVDGAFAHDAGVLCAVGGDERLAGAAAVHGNDAAAAGRGVEDAGIARGDEGGVLIDDESDAGAEGERAGEEDVLLAVGAEDDGLPLRAVVHRVLNAGRGELLLVGERDVAVAGDDVGLEGDAGGRNFGLGDGAVSCAGRDKAIRREREANRRRKRRDALRFSNRRGTAAGEEPAKGLAHFKWTDHSDHPT